MTISDKGATAAATQANDINDLEYIPPFRMVREALNIDAEDLTCGQRISMPATLFKFLFGKIIAQSFFDEVWYLQTNPDIQAAVSAGRHASAAEHYSTAGYYEGRSPGPAFIDRAWYENFYPDVAQGMRDGTILDAAEHYQNSGYYEGRAPTVTHLRVIEKWRAILGIQ